MLNKKPKEADWKRFSAMIVEWRERYLEERNRELQVLLTDPDRTPSERFWNTFEKMEEEGRILRECLQGHSRSRMFMLVALMCRYGLIRKNDLKDFSEQLQDKLKSCFPD